MVNLTKIAKEAQKIDLEHKEFIANLDWEKARRELKIKKIRL